MSLRYDEDVRARAEKLGATSMVLRKKWLQGCGGMRSETEIRLLIIYSPCQVIGKAATTLGLMRFGLHKVPTNHHSQISEVQNDEFGGLSLCRPTGWPVSLRWSGSIDHPGPHSSALDG